MFEHWADYRTGTGFPALSCLGRRKMGKACPADLRLEGSSCGLRAGHPRRSRQRARRAWDVPGTTVWLGHRPAAARTRGFEPTNNAGEAARLRHAVNTGWKLSLWARRLLLAAARRDDADSDRKPCRPTRTATPLPFVSPVAVELIFVHLTRISFIALSPGAYNYFTWGGLADTSPVPGCIRHRDARSVENEHRATVPFPAVINAGVQLFRGPLCQVERTQVGMRLRAVQ